MRPLTPFASYHDNLGHLLVGRVRFCYPNGSPAEVFSSTGVSLGSTVFTDSSGRLAIQPFLDYHDYVLFFDKYIGDGTMSEDDDQESWEPQGSAYDAYNVMGISVDSGSVMSVSTIVTLRQTDPQTVAPVGGKYMVDVLGYINAGDKPSIRYVWDAASTDTDNGGSVIKVSGIDNGRWVIQDCPDVLDVRHFGAFPLQTMAMDTVQRYRVQIAGEYAHSCGCGIRLEATDEAMYYDVTGLTLHGVSCVNGATLFCAEDQVAGIVGVGPEGVRCASATEMDGVITITDATVRTSWGGTSTAVQFVPTERLIIDSEVTSRPPYRSWTGTEVELRHDNSQLAFTDCTVRVLAELSSTSSITFDSCVIESDRMIDGIHSFIGCNLGPKIFVDGYDGTKADMSNSTVAPASEWDDVSLWVTLKIQNGDNDYDFCGRGGSLVLEKPSGANAAITVSNAVGISIELSGGVSSVFVRDCLLADIDAPAGVGMSVWGSSVVGTEIHSSAALEFRDTKIDTVVTSTVSVRADGCRIGSGGKVMSQTLTMDHCSCDTGSVVGENSSNGGAFYRHCSLYSVTAINASIDHCRVAFLNESVPVNASEWTSEIIDSTVSVMNVSCSSTQVPKFAWRRSTVAINQFTQYAVTSDDYVKAWSVEDCLVTYSGKMLKRDHAFGFDSGARKAMYGAGTLPQLMYRSLQLDFLFIPEILPQIDSSSTATGSNDPSQRFGYQCLVTVNERNGVGEYDARFCKGSGAKVMNVDGELRLVLLQVPGEVAAESDSGVVNMTISF